jgi:hypothetical protein
MLFDARHDALPSYAMRALAGAAMLGGFAAFILLIGGGPLAIEMKLLYALLPAIVGGAFGAISAAKDRNETPVGLALAYAIVGMVFGPLILGVGVAAIQLVAWPLSLPAASFSDLGWKWWIGSMLLASGHYSSSALSKVASQETSKTSLRYILCRFFGPIIDTFAIVVVLWMCFAPEFPPRDQWLPAAIGIGTGWALLEIGPRIFRSVLRRTGDPAGSDHC